MDQHSHYHDHHHAEARPIAFTLALVAAYMVLEVVGGLLTGSLSLLADAGHMLSDALALALTLFAMKLARRAPTPERTYGYYRAEILAALVNGAALVAIAVWIFIEAYHRFRNPPAVEGPLMLGVACGGLVVNGLGLALLHSRRHSNLNIRGAWIHVLTDALGSVQVIAAAALIWAFGWNWVDPLASVLIALLVIYSAWALIKQCVDVLMEGTPAHIDIVEVRDALTALPHVSDVHDLHIWTITSGYHALSAHVTYDSAARHDEVLRAAQDVLDRRFRIRHTTIQLDLGCACENATHSRH